MWTDTLAGRFMIESTAHDPQIAVMERMGQAVLKATDQLVQRQAQLWQGTIEASHQQWSKLYESTGGQLQTTLSTALDRSLTNHAEHLIAAERGIAGQIRQEWERVQSGLTEHASLLLAQQTELVRHGETLVKVLTATGDVMQLEQALNSNLAALAGSKNFEDTVMSLSAAIHLLNTRLGKIESVPNVDLSRSNRQGKAA